MVSAADLWQASLCRTRFTRSRPQALLRHRPRLADARYPHAAAADDFGVDGLSVAERLERLACLRGVVRGQAPARVLAYERENGLRFNYQ